ncbi:hypothetical protein BGZ65_000220, partial [Modicella reniformis]
MDHETMETTPGGNDGTGGPTRNKKRNKKTKNNNNDNNNDNNNNNNNSNSSNNTNKQHHHSHVNPNRRFEKNDPQSIIRNLDATPDLVGVSAEEDFSTLLLQHVEHKNKMIERDLQKQKSVMKQEQKKQTKLLAAQAAQLATDPQMPQASS